MAKKTNKKENNKKQPVVTLSPAPRLMREDEIRDAFKRYFIKLKRKLNLKSSLEYPIWLHLKAIECDKEELFDQGVRNFGYKTP